MANDMSTITKPAAKLGYSSAKKPIMTQGRRDFFSYRDLALKDASGGQMRGQIMKAITGMTEPTGWHYHTCDSQFVYLLNGWVELEFEGGEFLRLESGDSVFIPGGLPHNELRTSDDFEIIDTHHLRLRSERSGTSSGRTYSITITATNDKAVAKRVVTVVVPHDQGKGK